VLHFTVGIFDGGIKGYKSGIQILVPHGRFAVAVACDERMVLRAFNSSVGYYIGSGGALSNGHGSVFLWLFCALAFLKVAQRFDSYLGSIGLNVAQTGSGLCAELLFASRALTGMGGGFRSAGSMFRGGGGSPPGGGIPGFTGSFSDRFKGNSYVRDAVVQGGMRMGAGGPIGFIGRAFGGLAAKRGVTLNGESIASVANRLPNQSGGIAGNIADQSLGNYMPHLKGQTLRNTQIAGWAESVRRQLVRMVRKHP